MSYFDLNLLLYVQYLPVLQLYLNSILKSTMLAVIYVIQ